MSFVLPFLYNKFVSVWINNSNSVTGTYKNLSLKCDGNAEMNNTTITKLGVNSDTNASYAINANGSVNLTSGSTYKINGTNISLYVPNMDASFNDVIVDTLKITSDAIQGSSQNLITADDTDFNFFTYGGGAIFTSGTDNASCGIYAMGNIETGSKNTGIGSRANGVRNGDKNTACGNETLVLFETGEKNSAFGNEALKSLGATTGTYNNNTALGESALKWINGGNGNIGIGVNSGVYYTSGGVPINSQQTGYDNNIFIGNLSGFSNVGGSHTNSIVIGNNQIITASNKIFLGSSAQETIFNGGCNIKASTNLTLNGNIIANGLTISPTEIGYLDGLTTNINTKFGDIDTFIQSANDTFAIVAYTGYPNSFTDDNIFTEITTFNGASVFNGDSAFYLNTSFNGTTTATFLNTVNMSGATAVTVPTVATGINSTACASTAYVKSNLANYVSLSGTQTITGNKTISGTTTLTGNVIANSLTISPTEIGYLDTVSSNIQTQLDNKLDNSFSSAVAILASPNTFTQVNQFTSTNATGSADFYNPPTIGNASFSYATNNLITKAYADSQYLTSSTGVSASANNTFTGTNTFQNTVTIGTSSTTFNVNALNTNFANYCQFTNQIPTCTATATNNNQLTNKLYVDTYVGNLLTSANTFTATQTFSAIPKTTATPTVSTDLIPKAYADTNYSNAGLLASNNTWTGSNTYNQAFTVSNRTVSTGYNTSIDSKNVTIKADYDNNIGNGLFLQVETATGTFTGLEISRYALYSAISISTEFNQIQFNYPTYYATSAIVGAGGSFQVGNVYGSASFVVFDGTFSVSETNGQFFSNTLTALTDANPVTLYPSVTNSISIGNSASSQDVIINGNIKQNNYYRFKINPTLITSATTLSSPFYKMNKFAMTIASGYTITLPEVNNTNLDMELTFKRQGGSLQTLTVAQVNSQPIFGIGNSRGQITSSGMNNTQSLVSFVSTFVSPALTGNFTVTAQPTNIVNILSITSGSGSYITVGTTLTLAVGVTRIITGYGTGNGGTGTYTVSVNITTNYTNQPYTAPALYGWLATDLI